MLNLFDAEMFPKRSWRGQTSQRLGEGKQYLTLHSHHENDCTKSGRAVWMFNEMWEAKTRNSVHKLQLLKGKEYRSGPEPMSVTLHVDKEYQMAYCELRRISPIRQHLTDETAQSLAVSFVLSRLDYGKCMFAGVSYKSFKNCIMLLPAWSVLRSSRRENSKSSRKELRWLPVSIA